MHTKSLPVGEMVTLAYLAALVIALSMIGCSPAEDPTSQEPVRIEAAPLATPVRAPEPPTDPQPEEVTSREVTYEEAEDAYSVRDYELASELFTRYVDSRPDNPWGHYMLGLSAHKAGQLESAELAFREALHLDSTHVKSWQNLTRVFLDGGRADEALESIARADALETESPVNLRLTGRALHQQGNLTGAADAYRDAILADDTDVWSMNNLAVVLMEEGRYAQALTTLAHATALAPDVALFQNNLGMALEHQSAFRDAEAAYGRAVELDADYQRASANLARMLEVESVAHTAVDLAEAARTFVRELESWRDEHVARELGDEASPTTTDATQR